MAKDYHFPYVPPRQTPGGISRHSRDWELLKSQIDAYIKGISVEAQHIAHLNTLAQATEEIGTKEHPFTSLQSLISTRPLVERVIVDALSEGDYDFTPLSKLTTLEIDESFSQSGYNELTLPECFVTGQILVPSDEFITIQGPTKIVNLRVGKLITYDSLIISKSDFNQLSTFGDSITLDKVNANLYEVRTTETYCSHSYFSTLRLTDFDKVQLERVSAIIIEGLNSENSVNLYVSDLISQTDLSDFPVSVIAFSEARQQKVAHSFEHISPKSQSTEDILEAIDEALAATGGSYLTEF